MSATQTQARRRGLESRLRMGDPAFDNHQARVALRGGPVHFFQRRRNRLLANVARCGQLTVGMSSPALGAPLLRYKGTFCRRCLDALDPEFAR
ncbi:MAG: hypothetical protein ACTSX8_03600 [Alphaproteobacteria bacterium]